MSDERQRDSFPKLRWPDEIDEIFGRANPNPTREGCPPKEVLIALSRRERPLSDPGYVHLTKCSPCYLETRALFEDRRLHRRWHLLKAAAAAVIVVAIALAVWFFAGSGSRPTELRAELDLRPYSLMRGEPQESSRRPLPIPRARVALTMLLPVGSEAGMYEVQVLDSELRSIASAPGTAEIKNYVTTLQTTVDLRSIASGTYQLAIRRSRQEWQLFPAQVQ